MQKNRRPLVAGTLCVLGLASLFLVSSLQVQAFQDAGAAAVWKDKEIRKAYSPDKNETTIFFALLPSCASASPTVTFAATFHAKEVTIAPGSVEVRAELGILHVNPNVMRTRTLKFLLDRSTTTATTIDLSARLHPMRLLSPSATLDTATASMDLADFIQLLSAQTAGIDVFGIDCSVNASQMEALRSFATLILPPRR